MQDYFDLVVLIPFFNPEKFRFRRALHSVDESIRALLKERILTSAVVLVDDGSLDPNSYVELVEDCSLSAKVFWIHFAANEGVGRALNEGIHFSMTNLDPQFICRMDSDDICHRDRFVEQVDFLKQNPEIDICGCWVDIAKENTEKNLTFSRCIKMPGPSWIAVTWEMFFFCPVAHPSIVFTRRSLIKLRIDPTEILVKGLAPKWYSEEELCEDYALWSRAIFEANCKIANVQKSLITLVKHDGNASRKRSDLRRLSSISIRHSLTQKFVPWITPEDVEVVGDLQLLSVSNTENLKRYGNFLKTLSSRLEETFFVDFKLHSRRRIMELSSFAIQGGDFSVLFSLEKELLS